MMIMLGRFFRPFFFLRARSGDPALPEAEALPKNNCKKLSSPPIVTGVDLCYYVIIPVEYAYSTK